MTSNTRLFEFGLLTVLFDVRPARVVCNPLSGVVKSLIENAGLFCATDPPPFKLNEPALLVMKFTPPPLFTLQAGRFWIVRAFTPRNDDGELEELGFS